MTTLLLLLLVLPTFLGLVRSLGEERAAVIELGWQRVVPQSEANTCGPAVLATILAWKGMPTSERLVAASSQLLPDGMTLAEFSRVAAEFELPGHWFMVGSWRSLAGLPLPLVVHLKEPSGHFAILVRLLADRVQLADPARGNLLMLESRFRSEWTGRVFVFGGAPAASEAEL